MKRTLKLLAGTMLLACSCNGTSDREELLLNKNNIPQIVKAMTLEEKCHLVVGGGQKESLDSCDQLLMASIRNIVPGSAGTTYAVPRLGIPAIVLADGPAGLRIKPLRDNDSLTYYCTGFPIGTLLASSWDPETVEAVGRAMGEEVLEYGVDVLLAPGANLHRNPLCGRNFEYYSEDPLLSGTMAAAFINGVQSNGVGTSLKHFALNNCEINRLACDSRVSIRALRELYLKNWEVALRQSSPWTIMTSYNYLNGVYTSEDEDLISGVLRGDWGYKGCLMTDWGGGQDPAAQIHAGNDMIQPGKDKQYQAILEAVQNGSLSEEDLDACVTNILQLIVKTPRFAVYAYSNKPDLAGHAQITREKASEGFVLLKNDASALPLADSSVVALFGKTSYRLIAGGTGSGDVNKAYTVNLDEGLLNDGILLDEDTYSAYKEFTAKEFALNDAEKASKKWFEPQTLGNEMPQAELKALAQRAAASADAAVITIGRNSGEGTDRHITDDFLLTEGEQQLISTVSDAFHAAGKTVSVVLNIAGVIETASWKDNADAILLVWQPGQEAGNSVADVLTGLVNPSGRLPMTFPERYADVPAQNFPSLEMNTGKNDSFYRYSKEKLYEVKDVDYIDYKEDIFMGYRHYCSHCSRTSYPFGYGLSYTDFEIENLKVSKNREGWTVKVNVSNVGENPGRDVIQLYSFGNPANPLECPVRELKGFAKTSVLQPGESQTVIINVKAADLASYAEERSAWVLTPGIYAMAVTADCEDYGMSFGIEVKKEQVKATGDYLHPRGQYSDRIFIDE